MVSHKHTASSMRCMRRALHDHQRHQLRMFELSRRACVLELDSRRGGRADAWHTDATWREIPLAAMTANRCGGHNGGWDVRAIASLLIYFSPASKSSYKRGDIPGCKPIKPIPSFCRVPTPVTHLFCLIFAFQCLLAHADLGQSMD